MGPLNENKQKDFLIDQRGKNRRLQFIIGRHDEGEERIWLEPYYLEGANMWGFLIDFKFSLTDGISYTRKVQILSLSLNSIGRSNKELSSDKYRKIKEFARLYYEQIFKGRSIDFLPIHEIDTKILDNKKFVCAGGEESNPPKQNATSWAIQAFGGRYKYYFPA